MRSIPDGGSGLAHVILSPHLDDAVASCGGLIARQVRRQEDVAIFNCCSGFARPPYSPLARQLHRQWGDPIDVVAMRRAEDTAACRLLGCTTHWDDNVPDAIYRRAPDGRCLYPDVPTLFGAVADVDQDLVDYFVILLRSSLQKRHTRLYAPLAIGNHVDHQLVREVGRRLMAESWSVWFYQDFPYAMNAETSLGWLAEHGDGQTEVIPLSQAELEQKIRAFNCYASQLASLFGRADRMRSAVLAWSQSVGGGAYAYAARYWRAKTRELPTLLLG